MKRINKTLGILLTLFLHREAYAATGILPADENAGQQPLMRCRNVTVSGGSEKLLAAVAGNASAATRTMTIPLEGQWAKVLVQIDATRVAYTAIAATASCSLNHRTSYADLGGPEAAGSGAWSWYPVTVTRTTSASSNVLFEFTSQGCHGVKVVVSLTGGGASDAMDGYAVVCSQ